MQTKLSLIVAMEGGDDPIRATGLLFVHLLSICRRTNPTKPQIWKLAAAERSPLDPMDVVTRAAEHRNVTSGEFLAGGQLSRTTFAKDPLA